MVTVCMYNIMYIKFTSGIILEYHGRNSPFPSSPKPLHQSEAWCTTIHMEMGLICKWKDEHQDWLWGRDLKKFGNGLLKTISRVQIFKISPERILPRSLLQGWASTGTSSTYSLAYTIPWGPLTLKFVHTGLNILKYTLKLII